MRWTSAVRLACLLPALAGAAEPVRIDILPEPLYRDMPRIGLNLGEWNAWGASQFMRNVLKNPGFEGTIDRALVVVAQAGSARFSDDTAWTGRPDGFWTGARYSVRAGLSAGQEGRLADSRQKGRDGLPEFLTEGVAPPLMPGDVVALTRIDESSLPSQWQPAADSLPGQIRVAMGMRPGGGGQRLLRLEAIGERPARIAAYLDAIGDRAGKLLPMTGRWAFSVWAQPASAAAKLTVTAQRIGAPPFLKESIPLKPGWQKIERGFEPRDTGPAGTLEVRLEVTEGATLLDDIDLGAQTGEFPFRPEMAEVLARLKPGYLRDWEGQLGDSWTNRVADPYARRASRYRPGPEDRYPYGLAEFFDLCRKVGANPWVILPTTFDDDEYLAMGRWLAERQRRDGFAEIVVEFGNENWNSLFRPAGLARPEALGAVASRAFAKLAEGAGTGVPLRYAVNGQHVNPEYALRMLDAVPRADLLAVAPYFLGELNRKDFDAPVWPLLFRPDVYLPKLGAETARRQRGLAVYEVNLHTTRGDAGLGERNSVVAGAAAGAALGQRLLEAMSLGVARQCVYVLAQYDAWTDNHELVKLWGVARDLGESRRLRPTGLALGLLNETLPGDVHATRRGGTGAEAVTALAIQGKTGWHLALVSAAAEPLMVEARFPQTASLPRRLRILDGTQPEANNETDEQVRIVESALPGGAVARFGLPPRSLAVLLP